VGLGTTNYSSVLRLYVGHHKIEYTARSQDKARCQVSCAKYLALVCIGMTAISVYIVTGALSAPASVFVLLR
jgi:hypothetical protein